MGQTFKFPKERIEGGKHTEEGRLRGRLLPGRRRRLVSSSSVSPQPSQPICSSGHFFRVQMPNRSVLSKSPPRCVSALRRLPSLPGSQLLPKVGDFLLPRVLPPPKGALPRPLARSVVFLHFFTKLVHAEYFSIISFLNKSILHGSGDWPPSVLTRFALHP